MNSQDYNFKEIASIIDVNGCWVNAIETQHIIQQLGFTCSDEFLEFYGKIHSKAKNYGLARALKASSFFDEPNPKITFVGLYILLEIAKNYKKYSHLMALLPYFKEEALKDLLLHFAVQHNKPNKKKTLKTNQSESKTQEAFRSLAENNNHIIKTDYIVDGDSILYNKNIVIAGNFRAWPQRDDLVMLITSFGGIIQRTANKSTDYVILGAGASTAIKRLIKTNEIETYDEADIITLLKLNI